MDTITKQNSIRNKYINHQNPTLRDQFMYYVDNPSATRRPKKPVTYEPA